MQRNLRRIGYFSAGVAGLWAFDKYYYYSTIQRNVKTLVAGIIISLDYKLNFTATKADQIDALHERTANRILDVCKSNGGLYIKFGQQISTVPVLPKPYEVMRQLYDKAPYFDYQVVEDIFKKDFGVVPDDVFATFSREPVASASIAQVHKATLKDGTPVAVKIQKPAIEKQIFWDMLGYRGVIFAFEKLFDLPLYWTADYIEKHLKQETDFLNEVSNSERCYRHIQEMPHLKDRVYVPKNIHELCSKHVMTSEWIDGVNLTDKAAIESMGLSVPKVMTNVVNVFSDQLFRAGFVHCDPHPGNILVRKHPFKSGEQVVLLDHGLYVQCSPGFTRQYASFWKSLFSMDYTEIDSICESWGIRNSQMFATATLARPWKKGKAIHVETTLLKDVYESQMEAKKQVSKFLKDTEKIPKELIFVGRNLNCVRANNKILGSPVNRINLMVNTAVRSLGYSKPTSIWKAPYNFLSENYHYFMFHVTLTAISLTYYITDLYQRITGSRNGFESVIDKTMVETMQKEFPGMTINENAFDG